MMPGAQGPTNSSFVPVLTETPFFLTTLGRNFRGKPAPGVDGAEIFGICFRSQKFGR